MKKFALVIAVENFQEAQLDEVPFATNDALAFSQSLQKHGFEAANQVLLCNDEATVAAIRAKTKRLLARLKGDDVLYFFYVGRGFAAGGGNYLAACDTRLSALARTGVDLAKVFAWVEASHGIRIAFFLSCCHQASAKTPSRLGPTTNLQPSDLEELLIQSPHAVCFTACDAEETSHLDRQRQQSIWAEHLVDAFAGKAPLAIERGMLTARSLQHYLAAEVPRSLRRAYTDGREQNPTLIGMSAGDFFLADMRPILAGEQPTDLEQGLVVGVSLSAQRSGSVKNLSGWKKTFRLPDRHSDSSDTFIAQLAAAELKEDLDEKYEALRRAFGLARRDLNVAETADGAGTIITPHFNYSVSIGHSPANPLEFIVTRMVSEVKSPREVESPAFAKVFDRTFDTLEFSLPQRVEIGDFIDGIEAAGVAGLHVGYDREATYCELRLVDEAGTFRLSPRSVAIYHDHPKPTRVLIQSFQRFRSIVERRESPLLSLAGPKNR